MEQITVILGPLFEFIERNQAVAVSIIALGVVGFALYVLLKIVQISIGKQKLN